MTLTTPVLNVAGWTLLHFVWQGAAIAAATGALLRLMERRSPNTRYAIACAGLIAMLAAPAGTARVLWPTALLPGSDAANVSTAPAVEVSAGADAVSAAGPERPSVTVTDTR